MILDLNGVDMTHIRLTAHYTSFADFVHKLHEKYIFFSTIENENTIRIMKRLL